MKRVEGKTMLKILPKLLLTFCAAVVVTACATSSKQPQMRVVGVDGREVQQVVPLGVAPSEPAPAPAGQKKPGEKRTKSG